MRYEFSVYSPGTPPWKTGDGSGGWLADHSPPADILFLPRGPRPRYGEGPGCSSARPPARRARSSSGSMRTAAAYTARTPASGAARTWPVTRGRSRRGGRRLHLHLGRAGPGQRQDGSPGVQGGRQIESVLKLTFPNESVRRSRRTRRPMGPTAWRSTTASLWSPGRADQADRRRARSRSAIQVPAPSPRG